MSGCRKATESPCWNGFKKREKGHTVYHHHRIRVGAGCGTHHQTGSERLPSQAGTPGTPAGTGGRIFRPLATVRTKPKDLFRRTCPRILEVERYARLVAPSDMSVLILGANGTGKESVAQSIHEYSERVGMPFVAVNCSILPRDLAPSMLFGHEKGAFTGADAVKPGFFDMAKGGTLFLDEIGTMSFEIQSMLLRVLQENIYMPIGGQKEKIADVRVVAATNENMERAIKEGRFREDLFHRLNEFEIRQPSLAECPGDILPLAEFFRERFSKELKRGHKWFFRRCHIPPALLFMAGQCQGVAEHGKESRAARGKPHYWT